MKNKIASLLLLVLLYSMGGYFFVFKLTDTLNRSAMQSFFSKQGSPELLIVDASAKIVRTQSREIIYAGKRYDVRSEKKVNDKIVFCCVRDQAEETIFNLLKELVSSNTDSQTEKHSGATADFTKLFIKDYCLQEVHLQLPCEESLQLFPPLKTVFTNPLFSGIITPPPQFFNS